MKKTSLRENYVKEYFDNNYGDGKVDEEVEIIGKFLTENARGKVLDCGCGPVPQVWAICMPFATEIHAIDLAKESIAFVKNEIKNKEKYLKNFRDYKKIAEKIVGKLPKDYILKQINKIKSIQRADMSKKIPFPNNYFDSVMAIFSLGVLKDELELNTAIREIFRVLKKGGKLLHMNTNGKNKNDILPEYTYRGLPQLSEILFPYLKKAGFGNISLSKFRLKENKIVSMYKYDELSFLIATKN